MLDSSSGGNNGESGSFLTSIEAASRSGRALEESCRSVARGLENPETIDAVLNATAFLADQACIYTPTGSDSRRLLLVGYRGDRRHEVQTSYRAGEGLVGRALESSDAEPSSPEGNAAALAVPIKLAQNTVAVLLLIRSAGPVFSQTEVAATLAIASVAGPLFRMEQLQLASQELVVQEERNRIAREIHDGVSQNLALLMLKMEIISRLSETDPARMKVELAKVMSVLEASVQELRRSVYALRSPDLARLGLIRALRRLARDFGEQTNMEVALSLPENISLPPQAQSAVFSVVQERLDVVAREGSATTVSLELRSDVDRLVIQLRDNGQPGLPLPLETEPCDPPWQTRLRDRIRPFEGSVQVFMSPPETRVEITLPMR